MDKAFLQPLNDLPTLVDKGGSNRAPALMENFLQILMLLSGQLTDQHMADNGADAKVLKDATIRLAKLASDVLLVRMAQGQYTGDGAADRVIATSDANGNFTPTEVIVLATTDSNVFESRDDGITAFSYWRVATGAFSSGVADWQGIVATGFKTGSNAASLSNKAGQVYSWRALRRG